MDTENHEICLLPGGQLLQAVQGQTLLEVFIGAGIFLRSDCGGKGLCDLVAGNVTASISVRNPQCLYGDDVMSRISAVTENRSYLARLQKMAVKAIEWGVASLCRSTRIEPEKIKKMVVVGNSTMIHIRNSFKGRSLQPRNPFAQFSL